MDRARRFPSDSSAKVVVGIRRFEYGIHVDRSSARSNRKTDRGDGTRRACRNREIASLCDLAPHRVHVVGMVRIAALENRLPLLETCDLNPKSP